ncbi:MAG: hypothetical protein JSW11_00290 [Candidatus Heimdallarchaeota archaeon]|nr:MAG: hypothetical protein JSW11_00290 [Candidatus Heimdallarchaeota archaeon]
MDFKRFFEALNTYGDKSFPDAAFIVEKGAEKDDKGKTLQKYRHLPHHTQSATDPNANGTVDLPHLRNALARVNQVKPVKEGASAFRGRAKSHLQRHAKALLESYKSKGGLTNTEREFINSCKSNLGG